MSEEEINCRKREYSECGEVQNIVQLWWYHTGSIDRGGDQDV